jgi:hypothetical protein
MKKICCDHDTQSENIFNMIECSNGQQFEIAQKDMPKLLQDLFVYPFGEPGYACEKFLNRVAQLLILDGVPEDNIRSALLVFLAMSSAKIGRPVSVILQVQDNSAAADHVISSCKRLIPPDAVIDLRGLTTDDLYTANNHFKNKALICRDFPSINKIASDLQNLIVNGRTTKQARAKSKYGVHIADIEVSGPVSFIGIEKEGDPKFFDHPCFLRVQLYDSHWNWVDGGGCAVPLSGIEFEKDRTIDYLNSFHGRKVRIPYAGRLSSAILEQKPINYVHKKGFIFNLISICTIFNNPPPPNLAKFFAKSCSSQEDRAHEWLKGQSIVADADLSSEGPLVASGNEYSIAKSLLDGIIPIQRKRPSSLRCELFEIVKSINFEMFKSSTIQKENVLDMLFVMNTYEIYWAKIEFIFKKLNMFRSDIVTLHKIAAELMTMKNIGLIEKRKFKDTNEHGYFITTLSVGDGLALPAVDVLFAIPKQSGLDN